MAYKRLIGMITVLNGAVVKSYGYGFYRPAGGIRSALRNLDRWGVDEIILIDLSGNAEPDHSVIREIHHSKISTPLAYGGGVRNTDQAQELLKAGCDRFVVESLCFKNPDQLQEIADVVGQQALIASVPVIRNELGYLQLNKAYMERTGKSVDNVGLDVWCSHLRDLPVAEILLVDMHSEDLRGSSSFSMSGDAQWIRPIGKGILWYGGIDLKLAKDLFARDETVGVAFAHELLERELSIPRLRRRLESKDSQISVRKRVRI